MFCTLCGATNSNDKKTCVRCGASLQSDGALDPPVATGAVQSSGKAIASLICGLLFFIFPVAIVAVILGHHSLSDIRKSGGRLIGNGMAIAGLVLGYMGLAAIPLMIIAAIAIPNLLRSRMAANEASAVGSPEPLALERWSTTQRTPMDSPQTCKRWAEEAGLPRAVTPN